jgi:hypothetical protein
MSTGITAMCSYCYSTSTDLKKCGKCSKRLYCSKPCQSNDWKKGHNEWCGKSGEIGYDYDIKEAPGKGLGVFALRRFEQNEIVMIERQLLHVPVKTYGIESTFSSDSIADDIQQFVQNSTLVPANGTLEQKLSTNCISVWNKKNELEGGLFVNCSRVNHDCIGNTSHTYNANKGFIMLVAARTIDEGEEITYCYYGLASKESFEKRKQTLSAQFGFICGCSVCTDVTVENKITEIFKYESILITSGIGISALVAGQKLVALYEELYFPLDRISKAYIHMFNIAQALDRVSNAKKYAENAKKYAENFYGFRKIIDQCTKYIDKN